MYRKIIAVFMAAMVVATTCVIPSFAADYQSKYNFWNWAYDHSWFLGKLITGSADNVCAVSDDSLHHSSNHTIGEVKNGEQTYNCVCDYCGQNFSAIATDLENSYQTPYSKVTSDNRVYLNLNWYPVVEQDDDTITQVVVSGNTVSYVTHRGSGTNVFSMVRADFYLDKSVTLYYDPDNYFWYSVNGSTSTSIVARIKNNVTDDAVSEGSLAPAGEYRCVANAWPKGTDAEIEWTFTAPNLYYIDETVTLDDSAVNIGGSVQYTDDNSNNKIYDAEFMDFSTHEYHNPVTDESYHVEDWQYDYSTRTYTGYTENGEVKIHYGDEHITVTEGGNTYNYYYAAPSSGDSGSGSGGDSFGDDDDDGLFGKIGELLGTLLGGLIDLVTGVLSGILDSLISLVEMTIEKLGSVVSLFGSFGDALRALWSWLPEDIIMILSAGVSVVIFAAVLKLFI